MTDRDAGDVPKEMGVEENRPNWKNGDFEEQVGLPPSAQRFRMCFVESLSLGNASIQCSLSWSTFRSCSMIARQADVLIGVGPGDTKDNAWVLDDHWQSLCLTVAPGTFVKSVSIMPTSSLPPVASDESQMFSFPPPQLGLYFSREVLWTNYVDPAKAQC
jgi:hypothetical protein